MILNALNFFRGTLKIKITGSYIERFFNICSKNDITLWNIKQIDLDEIHCNILIRDYKKLVKIINNTKCSANVLQKKGFMHILNRSKTRYVLFLGIVLTFCFYYVLTSFIWQINIEGTDKTALVFEAIENQGITIGTKTSDINMKQSQNNILTEYEEFLWLSLNVKGNSLNISVEERDDTPKVVDKNSPCDIVAEKSGQILSIDVLMGEKAIEVGETFTYGDLLVSSEMLTYSTSEDAQNRFVHSIANIKAKIWYNFESILVRNINQKVYTGNQIKKYYLVFLNNAINLHKNSSNPYMFYDKIIETKEVSLSDTVDIPVKLVIETYIEYEIIPSLLNEDYGVNLLSQNLQGDILKNIDGDILQTINEQTVEDEYIKIISEVTTLENIGIKIER